MDYPLSTPALAKPDQQAFLSSFHTCLQLLATSSMKPWWQAGFSECGWKLNPLWTVYVCMALLKSDREAADSQATLLLRREKYVDQLRRALRQTPGPLRNGLLVLGDLNTSLSPTPGRIGTGVPEGSLNPIQTDWQLHLQLLTDFDLVSLNTWKRHGPNSRTFMLSPQSKQGTLIDYAFQRTAQTDAISKQAYPDRHSPLLMPQGMQHIPILGSIPWPRVPHTKLLPGPKVPTMQQAHTAIAATPGLAQAFRTQVASALAADPGPSCLNDKLARAWEIVATGCTIAS